MHKPKVLDIIWESVKADVFDMEIKKLNEQLVPIYNKHFTHEEVKELLTFYEIPIGKKLTEKSPVILSESIQISQQWGMGLVSKIQQYLDDKHY